MKKKSKLKGVCLNYVEKYHTYINVKNIDLKNVQIQIQILPHLPTSLTSDD